MTSELAEYGGCDDNVVVREKVMEASFKSLELPPFTFRLASQNISRVNSKGQRNIHMPYNALLLSTKQICALGYLLPSFC